MSIAAAPSEFAANIKGATDPKVRPLKTTPMRKLAGRFDTSAIDAQIGNVVQAFKLVL
jgi:hypothetical protein